MLATTLGFPGHNGEADIKKCKIWLVVRPRVSSEDARSTRQALSATMQQQMQQLQEEIRQLQQKQDKTLALLQRPTQFCAFPGAAVSESARA